MMCFTSDACLLLRWSLLNGCHVNYTSTGSSNYGVMLRECIRHQTVARYVLESPNVKKLFDYIQLPYFHISADAAASFKVKHDWQRY
ncbi:hypothetical protein DKX38_023312 [Salix brachista]|uniref:Uncharacterized protein n=1 Tax=Salix brachista TaxID=2182728 RepID=A0A5N5JNY7_9ROSI|nr:hypothetical protein DKX38_023312 [Salix brachista]